MRPAGSSRSSASTATRSPNRLVSARTSTAFTRSIRWDSLQVPEPDVNRSDQQRGQRHDSSVAHELEEADAVAGL